MFAFLDTRLWPPFAGIAALHGAGDRGHDGRLAAASYYVVERPLLRFKEPRGTGGARSRTRAHAVAAKPES